MNKMQREIANTLKIRLERVNHDYLNYSSVSAEELHIRESEIAAIAYEIAELFAWDDNFDREKFMKVAGQK